MKYKRLDPISLDSRIYRLMMYLDRLDAVKDRDTIVRLTPILNAWEAELDAYFAIIRAERKERERFSQSYERYTKRSRRKPRR
jgi:hypothetical protein